MTKHGRLSVNANSKTKRSDIAELTHYDNGEFLDIVGYAIAHELFHLLCGINHTDTWGTVFGLGPYLSLLTTPENELLQINLKTKRGVTR